MRHLSSRYGALVGSRSHPEVEAVEGGVEVAAGAKAVHLHGHLGQEQPQEDKLC